MKKEAELINRSHWEERYDGGVLPWDSGITPPEVEAFWQSDTFSEAERRDRYAVDLGCGVRPQFRGQDAPFG